MSNAVASGGRSLGFSAVLFIVFLILKLTNIIDWRWIWVFSPLWIVAALVALVIVAAVVFAIIFKRRRERKNGQFS